MKQQSEEYHVHIEGAVSYSTIKKLSKKYNCNLHNKDLTLSRSQNIKKFFKNLTETLDIYKDSSDFQLLAQDFVNYLLRNKIKLCYAFISPGDFNKRRVDTELILDSINNVFNKYKRGIKIILVFDADRDEGTEHIKMVADQAIKYSKKSVGGFSLGGSEPKNLDNRIIEIYAKCKARGLKTIIHAGVSRDPQYLRGVVRSLILDRIAHATALRFDEDLAPLIKKKNIYIDLCPTSSYLTGIVDHYKELPINILKNHKIPFTINSDDPFFFKTNLKKEIKIYKKFFGN